MEMGWLQAEAVTALLTAPERGFEVVAVLKDLSGNNRLAVARKKQE